MVHPTSIQSKARPCDFSGGVSFRIGESPIRGPLENGSIHRYTNIELESSFRFVEKFVRSDMIDKGFSFEYRVIVKGTLIPLSFFQLNP